MTDNDFRPFAEFIPSAVEGLRVTWLWDMRPTPTPKPLLGTTCPAVPDLAGFTLALVCYSEPFGCAQDKLREESKIAAIKTS